MEDIAPISPSTRKKREKTKSANEPSDSLDGKRSGRSLYPRYSKAGSVRVRGTDAIAPINATKSLKKGMAFDTK